MYLWKLPLARFKKCCLLHNMGTNLHIPEKLLGHRAHRNQNSVNVSEGLWSLLLSRKKIQHLSTMIASLAFPLSLQSACWPLKVYFHNWPMTDNNLYTSLSVLTDQTYNIMHHRLTNTILKMTSIRLSKRHAPTTVLFSHDFVYATNWNWVLKFVQGKWCEINSREAFYMNIFGILCTSARAQNFTVGPRHTRNDATYTRSYIWSLTWFECMTSFGQYMHVKYHNALFSIKNIEKFSWGGWLWCYKWKNLGKKDRRITISIKGESF